MTSGPALAIFLTVIIHFGGMIFLLLYVGDGIADVFRTGPSRGSGGDGGEPPEDPLAEPPSGDGALPLPLPDAEQAPVRLREPGRLSDHYRRPARRPEHVPAPEREHEPA